MRHSHMPPFLKISEMNVYEYISYSNPDAANDICNKYGYYEIKSIDELAYLLQSIVARRGETAFKEIMELHPEKNVVLELFEKKIENPEPKPLMEQKRDCSCMRSADGAASNQGIATQTNLMVLIAAMIVSISIISMKK